MSANERADAKIEVVDEVMNKERKPKMSGRNQQTLGRRWMS